ncbi:t-SNARE [Sparassis latifolia]|uniref:Syntaxin-like protein n=1 Tax=Sparassis crispa TaxID=139825 RepID=A0A401GIR0_9APHY|nr:Syntaxin-like protein [Sparassis crispa]GBE82013.1 Syntaxin-like protein [Sparassis crispa]
MARDRLAALRAQRQQEQQEQQEQGGAPQAHEMSGLRSPDILIPATPPAGNGVTDPMAAFYEEVSSIQDSIATFSANVARIGDLHSRTLNSTDDGASHQNAALLDDLIAQTRDLSNILKQRIQALAAAPSARPQDSRIRKNQTGLLRSKFVEVLQNYQQVERDYRARYKQRVERQFKIVKPDATPEEVNEVVNDTDGRGEQVFAQALSVSTRYGESRAAYREVQDRHQDIRRIEHTLEELAQMFNDMSVLVEQQDETINAVDTTAGQVEENTKAGLDQTTKAVKSARAARRKRWYCFFLVLIILIIVGIVVGVVVGTNHH